MSKEEMIQALKSSEVGNEGIDSPVGKRMDELSDKELAEIPGASDVSPNTVTTPACLAGVAISIVFSVAKCKG